MDAILTDSHVDTKIKICILMSVIVSKLEREGKVWEGIARFVNQLERVQMSAALTYEGSQVRPVVVPYVSRAGLGMCPLKTITITEDHSK